MIISMSLSLFIFLTIKFIDEYLFDNLIVWRGQLHQRFVGQYIISLIIIFHLDKCDSLYGKWVTVETNNIYKFLTR